MSSWKGCTICGPHLVHRWWCPTLLRTLDVVVVGLATIALVVALSGSTPTLGWAGALGLIGGFLIADLGIRIGLRRRGHSSPPDGDEHPRQRLVGSRTFEGRWISFLRGPWLMVGPAATIVAYVILLAVVGFGPATAIFLCVASVATIGLVAWTRSIRRRKASDRWPYG